MLQRDVWCHHALVRVHRRKERNRDFVFEAPARREPFLGWLPPEYGYLPLVNAVAKAGPTDGSRIFVRGEIFLRRCQVVQASP